MPIGDQVEGGPVHVSSFFAAVLRFEQRLLVAARGVAERTGVPTDELYERALREVLVRDLDELADEITADQRRRGVGVSDEDGLALAYAELRAARPDRRDGS